MGLGAATEAAVARLRRIEGQIKGLQRMLIEGRDCTEIAQQLSAAHAALDRVAIGLITAGLERCMHASLRGAAETRDILKKLQRSFLMLR